MDEETPRTGSPTLLSAMAATLLACGGAALIAGAPDWVIRKTRVHTVLPGLLHRAFAMLSDRLDVGGFTIDQTGGRIGADSELAIEAATPAGAGRTMENCSRTLEIGQATALGCASCPSSPPAPARAFSRR